jgi:BolA family transcriptional regulator, general stress-responsive regulator
VIGDDPILQRSTMALYSSKGQYYARIFRKLTESLAPSRLVVIDETAHHAGHRESSGKTETHFRLEIVSAKFEGMRLIERQRHVYSILSDELRERVHALSMKTLSPLEELAKRADLPELMPDP